MDELWDVRLSGRENEPLWQPGKEARDLMNTYCDGGVPPDQIQIERKSDGALFSVRRFLNAIEEERTPVVWAGDRSGLVDSESDGSTSVKLLEGSPLLRTPIAGGWLVCLYGHGLTFVPDEGHAWDGRSVWRDLGRRPGLANLVGEPAE